MKKMGILLDDLTILNFPLLGKLFRRYFKLNMTLIVLVIGISLYSYLTQNTIYRTSVEFKNVSGTTNSPTSAIAMLLGETNSGLSATEIVGVGQSLDFHQQLAIALYSDPDFKKLNFNDPKGKGKLSFQEIFGNCKGERNCILSILRSAVPSFYEVVQNNEVRTKYVVSVMAMDTITAQKVLDKVKELIVSERVENIRHSLSEQRKISQVLVKEKKDELEAYNLSAISFKNRALDLQLEEMNSSAKNFNSLMGMLRQRLSHSEAKYFQTQQTLKDIFSDEEKEEFKRVSELRSRIELLQENIHKLKVAGESQEILDGLNDELLLAKKELKGFGDISKYKGNYEEFIEERDNNSINEKFNYNVVLGEVEAFKANYMKMVDSKKDLIREKLNTEKKLESLKPSFEYLKLLEAQNAKLKLLESTVVSDLVFDKFSSPVSRFKRATLTKTVLFGTLMTMFIVIVGIMFRYRFDGVVIDEMELAYNYNDLPIIGTTPQFSKK